MRTEGGIVCALAQVASKSAHARIGALGKWGDGMVALTLPQPDRIEFGMPSAF
jgi:hypothetical protein